MHWLAREGDGINRPVQIGDKGGTPAMIIIVNVDLIKIVDAIIVNVVISIKLSFRVLYGLIQPFTVASIQIVLYLHSIF